MTIAFSNFSFRYESLDKPTLKNINLRIEKGEKIVIIGPSGSGKSTLGQCLNGLIPHAIKGEVTGSLEINGKNISEFSMHDYTEQVGTVLQDTDSQFVGLSIGEDIAFALENQLISNIDMYPLVKSTAKMVDLADMLDRSPHDLSGGQKQRVSLAGILVDDVDILLFDEPLASLDPKTGKATIEIIDQLHKETNKTIVIIEHRLEDVLHRYIDRVILMERTIPSKRWVVTSQILISVAVTLRKIGPATIRGSEDVSGQTQADMNSRVRMRAPSIPSPTSNRGNWNRMP